MNAAAVGVIADYFADQISFAEAARQLVAAGECGDPMELLAHGPLLTAKYCDGCGAIWEDGPDPCPNCADTTALLARAGRDLPHLFWRPQPGVDPRDLVDDCRWCGRSMGDPQCCDGRAAALDGDIDIDLYTLRSAS